MQLPKWECIWESLCRNPSLGLAIKARAYKVAGQEGSPRVTPHAPRSVGKCEAMNPHTPKGASTLGIGIPVDFRIFRERLQGSKFNGLKGYLYHWKVFSRPIWTLQTQVMAKKRAGSHIDNLTSDH